MFCGKWLIAVSFLLFTTIAPALGPHELLVLINRNSPESIRVAREFARLRSVPAVNLVELDLPDTFADNIKGITPAEFTGSIWEPANTAMVQRGIDDHILAWIYSTKFPLVILSRPKVSLQGITLVRNRLPSFLSVEKGLYVSPLFAGPDGGRMPAHYPQSFDVSRRWLEDDMPLPSMMLGYTGENGNSESVVIESLRRGVLSDGSFPTGNIWFVRSGDIRSIAREWQFRGAVRELSSLDVHAEVVESVPAGTDGIIGLLMGASKVAADRWNYLPGCMAEHLTSFGALFTRHGQTRLTSWLDSGVTASCGTVTEPYALWAKFPSARFFVHYARGCSMIESFFQAVASPLQLLIVGEPLASPWRPEAELVVETPGEGETLSGIVNIRQLVRLKGPVRIYRHYVLLVDGRIASEGEKLELDTTAFPDGRHVLRVVGYRSGLVRNQVFKIINVNIDNKSEGHSK